MCSLARFVVAVSLVRKSSPTAGAGAAAAAAVGRSYYDDVVTMSR